MGRECSSLQGAAIALWGWHRASRGFSIPLSGCPQLQGTGNLILGCISAPAAPQPSVLNTHCAAGTACCSAARAATGKTPFLTILALCCLSAGMTSPEAVPHA